MAPRVGPEEHPLVVVVIGVLHRVDDIPFNIFSIILPDIQGWREIDFGL